VEKILECEQRLTYLDNQKRELDEAIDSEMNVKIDGFLQFADYFFDNLFTDWAVMDKIRNSRLQIEDTADQIQSVMEKLSEMKNQVIVQREAIQEKLEKLIVQVNI